MIAMRAATFGRALLIACLLSGAGAGSVGAQVRQLLPVDEAARDPALFALRARLIEGVQRRDTAVIYDVLAPDILNSFGGNGGPAEFRELWRAHEPDSELWPVLARVLAYGGAFLNDTLFMAPYVAARFPGELDAFLHVAVLAGDVTVHERPARAAPVLDTLAFDIVAADGEVRGEDGGVWLRIGLAGDRTGYVPAEVIGSPVGYRAGFVRRAGRWWLQVLVAGD